MCPFTRALNFIRYNFGPWILTYKSYFDFVSFCDFLFLFLLYLSLYIYMFRSFSVFLFFFNTILLLHLDQHLSHFPYQWPSVSIPSLFVGEICYYTTFKFYFLCIHEHQSRQSIHIYVKKLHFLLEFLLLPFKLFLSLFFRIQSVHVCVFFLSCLYKTYNMCVRVFIAVLSIT